MKALDTRLDAPVSTFRKSKWVKLGTETEERSSTHRFRLEPIVLAQNMRADHRKEIAGVR